LSLVDIYRSLGVTLDRSVAHLVVDGNEILKANEVRGISMEKKETKEGIDLRLVIKEGIKLKDPIHLCFGVSKERAIQKIHAEIIAEKDSHAYILAHCIFPKAKEVHHVMDGSLLIEKGAELSYEEIHWHGEKGGADVFPRLRTRNLGDFRSTFSLLKGRVGRLEIDYLVEAGEKSITEIITKVYGKENDEIRIREGVSLNGAYARSVIKSRIAVRDRAFSDVVNITEGNAPYVRGHVDCTEIVQGEAIAKATPIVKVNHEKAKVTHEAAIGSVDRKQLETLMAKGLEEKEAVDIIIKGMLR